MRNILFLCLVMTLVVPAVRAQAPDTIGLWFDHDDSDNVAPLPLYTPFEAYLVLHEPSTDAVAGAVFAYEVSDPLGTGPRGTLAGRSVRPGDRRLHAGQLLHATSGRAGPAAGHLRLSGSQPDGRSLFHRVGLPR